MLIIIPIHFTLSRKNGEGLKRSQYCEVVGGGVGMSLRVPLCIPFPISVSYVFTFLPKKPLIYLKYKLCSWAVLFSSVRDLDLYLRLTSSNYISFFRWRWFVWGCSSQRSPNVIVLYISKSQVRSVFLLSSICKFYPCNFFFSFLRSAFSFKSDCWFAWDHNIREMVIVISSAQNQVNEE